MPVINAPGIWGNLAAGLDNGIQSYQKRRGELDEQKKADILQTLQMLNMGAIDTPTAAQRLQAAGWTGQIQPSEKDLRRSVLKGGLGNATQEQAIEAGLAPEWRSAKDLPASRRARKAYLKQNYPHLADTELDDITVDDESFKAFEMQARYLRPTYDAKRGQVIDPRTGNATTPTGIGAPIGIPRSGGSSGGSATGPAKALNTQAIRVEKQIGETNQQIRALQTKYLQVPPELTQRRDSLVAVRDGIVGQMQGQPAATGGPAVTPPPVSNPKTDAAFMAELAETTQVYKSIQKPTQEQYQQYMAARVRVKQKYGKK